jgi:hypothetical protein
MRTIIVCATITAAEGTAKASQTDGMAIAEEILLREDLSEPVPAKEEKADQKKKSSVLDESGLREAPLSAEAVDSEDIQEGTVAGGDATGGPGRASSALPAATVLDSIVNDDAAQEKTEGTEGDKPVPGSLQYEMDTVSQLADAPAASPDDAPAREKLAKR